MPEGSVTSETVDRITTITFTHPKGNSLPLSLLNKLANEIDTASKDDSVHAMLLQSTGEKVFCAGASFDELVALSSQDEGTEFFGGFAKVLLAIRNSACPVICRVQGKAVGGGVGIIAASDYVLATESASIKLSELSIGLGPYTIEPAIRRKAGLGATAELAWSAEWHSATWCRSHSLFNEVFDSIANLDTGISELCERYRSYSRDALCSLKNMFRAGTEHWDTLLPERTQEAARLTLSKTTQDNLQQFLNK